LLTRCQRWARAWISRWFHPSLGPPFWPIGRAGVEKVEAILPLVICTGYGWEFFISTSNIRASRTKTGCPAYLGWGQKPSAGRPPHLPVLRLPLGGPEWRALGRLTVLRNSAQSSTAMADVNTPQISWRALPVRGCAIFHDIIFLDIIPGIGPAEPRGRAISPSPGPRLPLAVRTGLHASGPPCCLWPVVRIANQNPRLVMTGLRAGGPIGSHAAMAVPLLDHVADGSVSV
jgi:hypothetical protein